MLDVTEMEAVAAARARHVIAENSRVLETVPALRSGDLHQVGSLMNASHASLRDLYGVSSLELDTMVMLLRQQSGCYGARLTGGGFGGCAVALMAADAVDAAILVVAEAYCERTELTPALYPTRAGAGASPDRF
jgi:galactokinase